jgi:uncharacterized membrane protein
MCDPTQDDGAIRHTLGAGGASPPDCCRPSYGPTARYGLVEAPAKNEWLGLLDVAGLDLEALYGGFDRTPLTDESREHIFVAVRHEAGLDAGCDVPLDAETSNRASRLWTVSPARGFTHPMTMRSFRRAVLVVATMTMGLMAGVFAVFANAIMPGLRRTDDRTFVGAFQSIDEAITNPLFLATFTGVLVITGLAAALHLRDDGRSVLPWIAAAFVLYLAVFIITVRVNVPLNDGVKAAGDPDRIADLAAVRERFDEENWVRWNIVRAALSTAALGCLAWALVLQGGIPTPHGAEDPAPEPGVAEGASTLRHRAVRTGRR